MLLRDSRTFVYEYPVDVFREVVNYKPNLWHRVVAAASVSGIIALLITITICRLLINGRSDVPRGTRCCVEGDTRFLLW